MNEKIAVISGGASGMGLALTKELGKYGPVFIGDISESKIQQALEELRSQGIDAYGKRCDVSDYDSVQAFAHAAAAIAPIGCAVNTAGISFTQGSIESIIKINALGTICFDNVFLSMMEDGTLINFASESGWTYNVTDEDVAIWNDPEAVDFVEKCEARVKGNFEAYCYSKRFVIYHTMANATRFAHHGIRILSISPGAFETPMLQEQAAIASMDQIANGTAVGRIGVPDEMAHTVCNLMDHGMDYLTGTDIRVDGGRLAAYTVKQLQ